LFAPQKVLYKFRATNYPFLISDLKTKSCTLCNKIITLKIECKTFKSMKLFENKIRKLRSEKGLQNENDDKSNGFII